MLKDMVRDLEQIHEQKHSTIITQQQQLSANGGTPSSGNTLAVVNSAPNSVNGPIKPPNTASKPGNNGDGAQNVVSSSTAEGTPPTAASSSSGVKSTASPAKTMLNQATNTPPKSLAQVPNGKPAAVLQQPGKVLSKVANTPTTPGKPSPLPPAPSTAVHTKVTSKATSTHPTTPPGTTVATTACSPGAKDDHKKTCHRGGANGGEKGDGSCVCYYCTLFGQSVCLVSGRPLADKTFSRDGFVWPNVVWSKINWLNFGKRGRGGKENGERGPIFSPPRSLYHSFFTIPFPYLPPLFFSHSPSPFSPFSAPFFSHFHLHFFFHSPPLSIVHSSLPFIFPLSFPFLFPFQSPFLFQFLSPFLFSFLSSFLFPFFTFFHFPFPSPFPSPLPSSFPSPLSNSHPSPLPSKMN